MASISTSIELYDKVSAPIYKMLGALGNLTSAFESVETSMDGGFDTSQIEAARRATEQAALEVVQLGNEIEENERSQQGFNKQVKQGASDMDDLTNKVMGLVGAYASFQGVQKLINLSDEYVQTTARLNMINDGLQSTEELQDKILASAQRSRAAYTMTADTVAKLSLNAKDAFGSNDETIAFAENLNKLFVIAGTEQQAIASASLQLTQALGSGVLRGEEFNAVFEAAPNIMQTVADYMGVPIGSLRAMAQEGQITADIVKNALLSSTDEINTQFESMPMTWNQVWTGIMNELYVASQPILEFISLLAQNWSVLEPIVLGLATAIGLYTAALLVYNTVKGVSALLESVHAAAQMMATDATFAATAAQHGFNAALLACPLTWILLIIIAVIAAIYAIVAAINKVQGTTISATGVIVGAIMAAVAFIWNLFLGLVDLVLACINYIANPWIAFANFFGNLFNDPIGAIVHLFGDMADNVLGILENIAKAIDKVFGSNLASAVQGWRSGLDSKIEAVANEYGNGSYEKVMDGLNLSSESLGLKRWAYSDAYKTGYSWGEGIDDSVSSMFSSFTGDDISDYGGYDASQIPSNIADTAGNTGDMKDSLDITSEDLKYLRDIAETEVVNRFTTAEIKVEMTNHNNVSSDMDLDGVVDYLANGVNEAMEKAAEGVHE
jgi:tape measure domain-containing protein